MSGMMLDLVLVDSVCAQLCPTLCNIMNCSPPGSSVHGDSPGKNTGVGCHALLQGFPDIGIEPMSFMSTCIGRWALYC